MLGFTVLNLDPRRPTRRRCVWETSFKPASFVSWVSNPGNHVWDACANVTIRLIQGDPHAPLGLRVQEKLERIIDKHMHNSRSVLLLNSETAE